MTVEPRAISQDAFVAIGGSNPSNIPTRADHPVRRLGIAPQVRPLQTNKFYANFFLGGQNATTFTHPYSVAWCKGSGVARSWGMAIAHIDNNQKVIADFNPSIPGNPAKYYFNPIGIQSMILTAGEFSSTTVVSTDTLKGFSVNVNLKPSAQSTSGITFPLVQGMGFVTGVYKNLLPVVRTSVFFDTFTKAPSPKSGVFKYKVKLMDGKSWLVYVIPDNGQEPNFVRASNTMYRGPAGFNGVVQVAKNPFGDAGESLYDAAAGAYPVDGRVSGSVTGSSGQYKLSWTKKGRTDTALLMFALPHHVEAFDSTTKSHQRGFQLATTVKGMATAVLADSWTMLEPNLPTGIGFAPWDPLLGSVSTLSAAAKARILSIAASEVGQDMDKAINDESMYFSGKRASKYATLVYAIRELLGDQALADTALAKLKAAVARFVENRQTYPLVYESAWKGCVSTASYATNDPNKDFGNTYYNDHHFHYGYWIHTAAIIGRYDPAWAQANKDWVNMLLKDTCNPISDDPQYPFCRAFDWYNGHSWAHGLTEFADGKDQESTSEEGFFAYAIRMWARVIGFKSTEARGNLMLAILTRSFRNYFYMDNDNVNQPARFIGNKVAGITFENKCDHATWFDGHLYAIQGIHMIPINPSSALTRSKRFVQEEWDAYFRPGGAEPVANITNGWKGIIYANRALIDPNDSWNFFSQSAFDPAWLDDGASRTWYLAYAAALGGGPRPP